MKTLLPSSLLSDRRRLFTLLWIVLGVFLVLRTGGRDRGVITDHLEFGRRLVAGLELYAPYEDDGPLHSVYPPSFGLLTWPFAQLGERAARYAWGLAQVAALWAIGWFLLDWLRRLRPALWPRRHELLLVVVALAGRYVLRDTHGGGGNLINLALALGAVTLGGRGRPVLGGVLLGLSLATKPTLALLLPALLVFGMPATAAAAVVTAGLLGVASVAVHGHGLEAWRYWLEGVWAYGQQQDLFRPALHDLPRFTWMNQSLRCMVARYLGTVPPEWAAQVPGFVQGAGFPPPVTAGVARLLGFAVLGVTAVAVWRWRGGPVAQRRALALLLVASLLLSPISWKAHHVALIPAFFLLAQAAWAGVRGARAVAVGYFVICSAGGGDLVGDAVKEWQQSLYLATLGNLVLGAWLLGAPTMRAPSESLGDGSMS